MEYADAAPADPRVTVSWLGARAIGPTTAGFVADQKFFMRG